MNSAKKVSFHRELIVKYETDVFVAGGGPSGVAAAIGAAVNGCDVLLAEGQSALGGMGTMGLVPVFMQFSDGENFLAAGVGQMVLERLRRYGGTGAEKTHIAIKPEVLKRVYDDLLLENKVKFLLTTHLIDVERDSNGHVSSVILSGKSGIYAIKAKMYVDCTGDGDLAAWALAPFEKGDEHGNLMAGTLCSLWAGVDWDRANAWEQEMHIEKAYKEGVFSEDDRHLPGMFHTGKHVATGNIGHAFGLDGTDEVSVTNALVEQRKRMLEFEAYYKTYLKGFEDMELAATAAMMGVRETRRIIGDYVLGLEDFKKRAVFDDEIGRYCYAVDIHESSPDEKAHSEFKDIFGRLRYDKGESYGIPYRTLIPIGLENVLVAGRCISCDRYIQGSVRVMPGCYITGQAAGAAAAIAAKSGTGTRGVDIHAVQRALLRMGAFLPNFKA